MKNRKRLLFLSLLLALFFLLATLSEFFFSQGKDKTPEIGLPKLDLAAALFPLSGAYPGEAGFALVEKGFAENDRQQLQRGSRYLLAALRRNPLDFRSRYYLAKAYLSLSAPGNDYFEKGVAELKRAAAIRGSNKTVAVDCARVFFSIWPLLEEEEQEFTARLLAGVMPALSWGEFRPLVEMWALYVQDAPLLMKLLQLKPEFFGPAANQLVAAGLPLAKRWEMLALYEADILDAVYRRHKEFELQGGIGYDDARALLNRLLSLRGYHRLQQGAAFDTAAFSELRLSLCLEVLKGMVTLAREDVRQQGPLRALLDRCLSDLSAMGELDRLQKLLQERDYFKENDFPSLRVQTMIALKKSDFAGVIAEVEALRKGISFIKKEQAVDWTAILLMLVDSYYSSKLMTAAEAVAAELLAEQPDNPDVLWRVLRIQKIMGIDGPLDPALQEKLARVENSRLITVAGGNLSFDAYLFGQPQLEIAFDPAWRAAQKPQRLLQVFVDELIAYEQYVAELPEKIVIGPPFVEIESKARVQIRLPRGE